MIKKMLNRTKYLRPTQTIALGFLAVILAGSLILSLPISAVNGQATSYLDALFTATTSVCVTGLTVVSTADHWSIFGQAIILLLIQIGGFGVVTIAICGMAAFHRRIGLKNRILIQAAYGWDSMYGVMGLIRKIIMGTLLVEGVGAICYMPVLIGRDGLRGIWEAIFLSISAFCNAGMDIMGNNSLADFAGNYWVNIVTMVLIILGGLGFLVWWEALRLIRERKQAKRSWKATWHKVSLHTKIVLTTTIVCLLSGMVVVFLCEYHNPGTLGNMSMPQKLLAALFQSVTTRTAGFFTISQKAMGDASSLFCMLLMLIGGSPGGTAGGVKTVTVAMLFFAVTASIKGREETRVFHRSISDNNVKKGLSIILLSLSIWFVMTILLSVFEEGSFMSVCYETMSAIGTVGLSKDFTGTLHSAGKCIIILMMYLGRIGPITMAAAFLTKGKGDDSTHLPEENIMIG